MNRRNVLLGFLGILVTSGMVPAVARLVYRPGYGEMTENSDLVVIATPVARKELPGRTMMPGVVRGNDRIPAMQIETTFRVAVVLRGELRGQDQFTLLHLIEANPPAGPVANAQALVDFQPNSGDEYLLFLKHRKDGRYEAMNGQTDPAFSMRRLVSATATPTARPEQGR